MKMVSKKTIAAIVAGTFILAGIASPFIAQAAHDHGKRPGIEHRKVEPAKIAERMAEIYGIDQATILKYQSNGVSFRDLNRAAFMAEASGKSLDEVLALKTADNKWKDVAQTLNITKDQMKATHNSLTSKRLSAKLGIDKQTSLNLLEQGYKSHDIAMSGLLAQNTGKSIDSILDMKKINNTWLDVAKSLGVEKETLKQDMQKLRKASPRHFHK